MEIPKHLKNLPSHFWACTYNGKRHPQAQGIQGLSGGANCQQFVNEVLRYHGLKPPALRSSELWDDKQHYTTITDINALQPLDVLLWNDTPNPFGAHVGLYAGQGKALHLSKANYTPKLETLTFFSTQPEYQIWIGAKRLKNNGISLNEAKENFAKFGVIKQEYDKIV